MNNLEYDDEEPQQAATLRLTGSAGEFSVGTTVSDAQSVRVLYLQTSASFSLTGGQDEQLLEQLRPVREIFRDQDLDFSQLLQREIDDARVSFELIPYLLETPSSGLVKFFPPIIIVALPVKPGTNGIADYYPTVATTVAPTDKGRLVQTIRSGSLGSESFDLTLRLDAINTIAHTRPSIFAINPHNTRLVIVDGQHRAMALLALYRNLRSKWPKDENGQAIQKYYSHWDSSTLGEFKLDRVSLPVVLCVFPELDGNAGSLKVHEACRQVFLALNKNARPVSRARTILLEDNNLIAHFTRRLLSEIKNIDTKRRNIRLWSVDFEENGTSPAGDAQQARSGGRMALTSVTLLYQSIYVALLAPDTFSGLKSSFGFRGRPVRDFSAALAEHRLNGPSCFRDDETRQLRVDAFDKSSLQPLVKRFWERYGTHMLELAESFAPFSAHHRAYIGLQRSELLTARLRTVLFQSEGSDQVFRAFQSQFKDFAAQYKGERLRRALDELTNDVHTLDKLRSAFIHDRLCLLLEDGGTALPKLELQSPEVWKRLNELYEFTFRTEAFQHALFLTFFSIAERAQKSGLIDGSPEALNVLRTSYLAALNDFFAPDSVKTLKNLIEVFLGNVTGSFDAKDSSEPWKIEKASTTLTRVLVSEKKNPSDWGKFRYLLLEVCLYRGGMPSDLIASECAICRESLIHDYKKREIAEYAARNPGAVAQAQIAKIEKDCVEALVSGISRLWARDVVDRIEKIEALRKEITGYLSTKEEVGEGLSGGDPETEDDA